MGDTLLERQIGPAAAKIYDERVAKNSVYLEKLQKIVERLIDENDVKFELWEDGTKVWYACHPVWGGLRWEPSREKLPDITLLDKPEEMSKIQAELNAAIKEDMYKHTLRGLFMDSLKSPYLFYVLKKAKEFMTIEDFSVAMAIAVFNDSFDDAFCEIDGVSKDDVVEMLKACDPKIFVTDELKPRYSDNGEVIVFLEEQCTDEGEVELEPDLSSVFAWFLWPENLIRYYLDIDDIEGLVGRGVYIAKIKAEDIFGIYKEREHNVILNPNGLHDIEFIDDVTEWDEYCKDDWRDEYGDGDEDDEDEDEE